MPPPLPIAQDEVRFPIAPVLVVCGAIVLLLLALLLFLWAKRSAPAANSGEGGGATQSDGSGSGDGEGIGDGTGGSDASSGTESVSQTGGATQHNQSGVSGAPHASANAPNSAGNAKVGDLADQEAPDRQAASAETDEQSDELFEEGANSFFTLDAPANKATSQLSQGTNGQGTEAGFCGVTAEGKRFVYVVDVSSSMAGEKSEKARQELLDSIGALDSNQSFFVAFFNQTSYYQPMGRLVSASPRNKTKIRDWIMLALPQGGTDPREAIIYAISLKPDAIFVLSDGEFDPSVVDDVHQKNMDVGVPIHTIGFQTDAATLRQLAVENQGTYRYVP